MLPLNSIYLLDSDNGFSESDGEEEDEEEEIDGDEQDDGEEEEIYEEDEDEELNSKSNKDKGLLKKRGFGELQVNEGTITPRKTPKLNAVLPNEDVDDKKLENSIEKPEATATENTNLEASVQKPPAEQPIVKVKGRKGRPPDALRRQQMLLQQQENPNFQLDSEKKMGFLKYKKFMSKNSNVKEDLSEKTLTPEEIMKASLESATNYNNKLLRERVTLKEQMKKVLR